VCKRSGDYFSKSKIERNIILSMIPRRSTITLLFAWGIEPIFYQKKNFDKENLKNALRNRGASA